MLSKTFTPSISSELTDLEISVWKLITLSCCYIIQYLGLLTTDVCKKTNTLNPLPILSTYENDFKKILENLK